MHYTVTRPNPTELADLKYLEAQTAKVGPDPRLKIRGDDGETNWMNLTPTQMLAVQEALKLGADPVAFNPITVSITANTLGEALVLWCSLGMGREAIMDLANKHLTPEQVVELRNTLERKYGGTYPIWDTLDDMLRADGIIGA
jgi:hypothetical protein